MIDVLSDKVETAFRPIFPSGSRSYSALWRLSLILAEIAQQPTINNSESNANKEKLTNRHDAAASLVNDENQVKEVYFIGNQLMNNITSPPIILEDKNGQSLPRTR